MCRPTFEKRPGWPGGAGAVELRNHALRQVVADDLVVLGGLGHFRHPTEICGDDALQQALVVEAAGAEAFAVAGAGGHDQGQAARGARVDEALLQGGMECLRDAALNEPRRGDDVVVPDEGDRLLGRDHLIFLHRPVYPQRRLPHPGPNASDILHNAVDEEVLFDAGSVKIRSSFRKGPV